MSLAASHSAACGRTDVQVRDVIVAVVGYLDADWSLLMPMLIHADHKLEMHTKLLANKKSNSDK